MHNNVKIFLGGVAGSLLIFMSGCVSLQTQEEIAVAKPSTPIRQGIYHKVKKGETLWRIAKAGSTNRITMVLKKPRTATVLLNRGGKDGRW